MTHAFNSGCPCCLPRSGLSRRQFLCTTAAGVAAAPALAASVIGEARGRRPRAAQAGRPILLKGGCVLSLDSAVGDFEQADVLIEGKKISAVRPNISAPNAQVIDATNRIVMPGFVDTHRHMWQGFLRNVLPDGSLEDYIATSCSARSAPSMMPDDVYAADLLSALGCDRRRRDHACSTGRTSRIRRSTPTPASRDCRSPACGRCSPMAPAERNRPGHGRMRPHKYPGDIARLRKQYFSSDDQLVTLYPGGAWAARPRRRCRSLQGRARRRRPHHHPCRRRRVRPQRAPGEAQRREARCKDDTTYIHCCTLNDTEWKLIKDTGGTVSIAGYVETLMGHGNPPVQKAIDMGIRPSAQRRRRDLGAERLLHPDAHGVLAAEERGLGAAARRRQEPAEFLTAREVLEFATIEGARANGLEKKIGTLTPGKEADIIMLRTDLLNVMPMNNAVGAVVTSMGRRTSTPC